VLFPNFDRRWAHGCTVTSLTEGSKLKTRIAFVPLFLLFLTLAVVPTVAQDIYDNGPINGNTDAWNISNGYIVSNSFTCCREDGGGTNTVTGLSFGAWLFPGDTLTSAELSITSGENGGTSYFDQTINFTQSGCVANQYGYNVCTETSSFSGPTLNAGTYWINLQNGMSPSGEGVYWDENSGTNSMASENTVGTIPSEAFTLIGTINSTTSTTTTTSTGSVPEPSSVMLFGSGIIGLAGWLRRRFHS
jgi:hypothetical protein